MRPACVHSDKLGASFSLRCSKATDAFIVIVISDKSALRLKKTQKLGLGRGLIFVS